MLKYLIPVNPVGSGLLVWTLSYLTVIAFSAYFDENKLFHLYNTRQKDDFHTYIVQSEIGKRSIKFKGSKLWNELPTDVKEIKSTFLF